MINSMFQQGTDKVLDDQMRRPIARPGPAGPGFFAGSATAAFRGIGGAAAESIAFGAEIVGAFGQVAGAYPEALGITDLSDAQKADAEQQRRKVLTKGINFSNEVGDTFRSRAKDIMPSAETTGAAGQVLAGLTNFGAKAMGYTLTGGPLGVAALGGDVALTEADRLKQEGVDVATRTKAGGVAGVLAAASVVVPMSGATALIRGAKGVAVGESAIVGQSLAEKAILRAAGYDKLADTFDPLDPVALGLGLVPGALGAKFGRPVVKPRELAPGAKPLAEMGLLERQALPFDDVRLDAYAVQAATREGIPPEVLLAVKNAGEKSGPTATSPKGAQGVMQFMPATWREFGRGEATDPMNSIDAGARYLKKLHDAYGDWDAAVAHYNGGGAQAAIVRGGGRPTIPETAAYLQRVKAYVGKSLDEQVAAQVRANPDLEAAARVSQAAAALESSSLTHEGDLAGRDAHLSAVERASDQIGRGDPVNVRDLVEPLRIPSLDEFMASWKGKDAPLPPEIKSDFLGWLKRSGGIDMREKFDITGETSGILSNPGGIFKRGGRLRDDLASAAEQSGYLLPGEGAESRAFVDLVQRALRGDKVLTVDEQMMQAQRDRDVTMLGERQRAAEEKLQLLGIDPAGAKGNVGAMEAYVAQHEPRLVGLAMERLRDAVREMELPPEADALTARAQQIAADVRESARTLAEWEQEVGPLSPVMRKMVGDMLGPQERGAAAAPTSPAPKSGEGSAPAAPATVARAAAEASLLNPDLMVQMEGMDAPMRVADFLEQVRKDADQEARDAKLIEVAAACALRN